MGHSYTSALFHCVFSTHDREPSLTPAVRERLWPFIGGIAREHGMKALSVGGHIDHAHMLLSLKATLSVSKTMQDIKSGSSKFVHETFPEIRGFRWQEGYGAFSISMSSIGDTVRYIENQEQHHRRVSFQEEFVAFLKKHEIGYDERYIWS